MQKDNNRTPFRVQISEPSDRCAEVELPSSLAGDWSCLSPHLCSDSQHICGEEMPGRSLTHQCSWLAQGLDGTSFRNSQGQ